MPQINNLQNHKKKIIGVCVCPGKFKGQVQVVDRIGHFSRPGSKIVLVVPLAKNDRPDHSRRRIGAIISDEGGLLCRASILAREFKIPTVVGTGNATEILHNGDRVEVDADQGIISIL